ncbi:hypothetical protein SAMN02745673_01882 [Marinactinospora thermotolerans DSM 45154]|uniref:Glyoxalase-like domain-containing protein n=1 Tax=Marinactinospora thermotolerans DSM 45154 TaxID=1122192 RepID=A0A1T4PMM8_9ACTN|nr:glyoxalase/bleomycin resistance/dioxygenase family protein [Marinactinospora thermotolerans]SJZ92467.1 hypothetical protein SAMN02745673_01882 [Marinactinospora thermotolerans DSM 45154]
MATSSSARITLLVIYSDRVEECRTFYTALGLHFEREQHGRGPQHYAAVLDDGSVFEIYPAADRRTGAVRLGLSIDGTLAHPPLGAGRHVLTDPDGRKVDVQVA